MKILDFIIISISAIGGIWSALELFGTMANNSRQTLELRFSHEFFNIFIIIPLLVIILGSVILFLAFKERRIRERQVTLRLVFIGAMIIFLGFGVFSFYLTD